MPFSNGLRFEKLRTSLDDGFEYFDLKIKNEEFDFVSKEMRFYIDIEAVVIHIIAHLNTFQCLVSVL